MAECSLFEVGCNLSSWVESAVGDAIENMATAVLEAYGKVFASLGTVWVHIGTPNLTGSGGASSITPGSAAPNSGNITTVLGYVMWVSIALAVLSLIALGALIATRMRAGEGVAAVGKLGLVLAAVVLTSGASALVSGLLPAGPRGAGGAVAFLQSGLWWYMGALAVLSVIVGAARMVWDQRAEPGKETVKSLLTLVVVAGAGVTTTGLLVEAADSFSVWLLDRSLDCNVAEAGSACFGRSLLQLVALNSSTPAGGLGSLLIIILGLVAILAAVFQVVLMVARGGMLVVLAGILPLSASFTNTETGRAWFKKCVGWLLAFILYKPAAAIVYAAAFQLTGTEVNVFTDDGTGLLAVVTGLTLMVIALFAMPALMRFVTPMVGAMAGGGAGGAAAVGAMAALPTGAAAIGRLGSGATSAGAASGGSGEQGTPGGAGPSGGQATGGYSGGGGQNAAPKPSTQGSGAASGGATSAVGGGGVTTSGVSGGAASGAAASGASAGAAAGGATAAGAAAGPAGIAAGAALDAAKGAGQAAMGAVRQVAQDSTGEGEGGGPDGSR